MKTREKMYSAQIFRQHSLPVPVISIGNLVLGGTGKTPTVRHIAELLTRQGLHVAIVSRGYGGSAKQNVNIVSDGQQVFLSSAEAGDEPFMLAKFLPGVPVITGSRRIHPCRYVLDNYDIDAIILDDGFQHLAVARDIDTVLFDATTLAGNSRVLPGGLLREPVSSLNRCTSFLLTSITESNRERATLFADLLKQRFPGKPVFFSKINVEQIVNPVTNTITPINNGDFFAFCGIANPTRFKESLFASDIALSDFVALPDHAKYNQATISDLITKAKNVGAQALITTEKDFVKIEHLELDFPVHILKIRQEMDPLFDEFILENLNS